MNSQPANITDIGYSPVSSNPSEVFEYDRNSNILSLERVYAGEPVQDAAMSYVGNRLTDVNDASMPYNKDVVPSFAAGSYALEYDGDGRLVADGTRGITSIKYTTDGMGLPTRIDLGPDNRVLSSYLPDGTLMSRHFYSVRTRTVIRVNSKGDTIVRTIREPVINHRALYRGDREISGNGIIRRINTTEGIATVVKNASATAAQACAAASNGGTTLGGLTRSKYKMRQKNYRECLRFRSKCIYLPM